MSLAEKIPRLCLSVITLMQSSEKEQVGSKEIQNVQFEEKKSSRALDMGVKPYYQRDKNASC